MNNKIILSIISVTAVFGVLQNVELTKIAQAEFTPATTASVVDSSVDSSIVAEPVIVTFVVPIAPVNADKALGLGALPTSILVNLSNGMTYQPSNVTWNAGTPAYNGDIDGTYTFSGTLTPPDSSDYTNPNNLKASVNLILTGSSTPVIPIVVSPIVPVTNGSNGSEGTTTPSTSGSNGTEVGPPLVPVNQGSNGDESGTSNGDSTTSSFAILTVGIPNAPVGSAVLLSLNGETPVATTTSYVNPIPVKADDHFTVTGLPVNGYTWYVSGDCDLTAVAGASYYCDLVYSGDSIATTTATTTNDDTVPAITNNNGGGGSSSSSSGSSIYNNGYSYSGNIASPLTSTNFAANTSPLTETFCPLLTSYLRLGGNNDGPQVAKLQAFLKNNQDQNVDVTGTFDQKTDVAVRAFQMKYLSDTMGPWGASLPSGYVYITTSKKINQISCNTPLTLSSGDMAIINAYKSQQTANTQGTQGNNTTGLVAPPSEQNATSTLNATTTPVTPEIGLNTDVGSVNTASVVNASVLQRVWDFIKNIF